MRTGVGVFARDTKLWHPEVGWQTFPQGAHDPGLAWSEVEGGDPPPETNIAAALKAMTLRAETAEQLLVQRQADIDRRAQERDDFAAKVAGLERRAAAAERALEGAQADKDRYAAERDRAIQNEADVRRQNEALKAGSGDVEKARATIERLTAELAEANQRVATKEGHIQELETDLANAKAKLAAFDLDGDGNPGGSKPKK